jgi:predicted transcriptional regulator
LSTPELARFYTDLLLHSPATILAVRKRQDLSKSTAYKYANTLAELGVAEELDEYD